MELTKLYVLSINGRRFYYATREERNEVLRAIWIGHPVVSIVEYEIILPK